MLWALKGIKRITSEIEGLEPLSFKEFVVCVAGESDMHVTF